MLRACVAGADLPRNVADGMDDIVEQHDAGACGQANGTCHQQDSHLRLILLLAAASHCSIDGVKQGY